MLRVTRIIVVLSMMVGVAFATHAIAAKQLSANEMQSAISALQKQLDTTSTELRQAINTEHKNTQAAILDLHQQMQAQVKRLEDEMLELDTNLSKEIKILQGQHLPNQQAKMSQTQSEK